MIFSQGGSGGKQCHKDDAGVSGEGTEGGLGGLPQENVEYEVLQEHFLGTLLQFCENSEERVQSQILNFMV